MSLCDNESNMVRRWQVISNSDTQITCMLYYTGKLLLAKYTSTGWETLPTFNMQHLLIEIVGIYFRTSRISPENTGQVCTWMSSGQRVPSRVVMPYIRRHSWFFFKFLTNGLRGMRSPRLELTETTQRYLSMASHAVCVSVC